MNFSCARSHLATTHFLLQTQDFRASRSVHMPPRDILRASFAHFSCHCRFLSHEAALHCEINAFAHVIGIFTVCLCLATAATGPSPIFFAIFNFSFDIKGFRQTQCTHRSVHRCRNTRDTFSLLQPRGPPLCVLLRNSSRNDVVPQMLGIHLCALRVTVFFNQIPRNRLVLFVADCAGDSLFGAYEAV